MNLEIKELIRVSINYTTKNQGFSCSSLQRYPDFMLYSYMYTSTAVPGLRKYKLTWSRGVEHMLYWNYVCKFKNCYLVFDAQNTI